MAKPEKTGDHGGREEADYQSRPSADTLHETSDIHRLLVESVRDYAIFALDRGGYVLTWNAGAERLKGYTKAEIIGKHFSVFYPPQRAAAGDPEEELRTAATVGRYEEEGWRVRKDGSQFWANVVLSALHDEEGTLIGFTKVTRDLTERRRAEESLRQSEERFRLIVQSVRDYGIFMLDPTGHVESWNLGAENIKGYTADEIIGKHFSTFYPQEDLDWDKPGMELRVAAQTGRFEDEGWRVKKDGSTFWANVVITALRNEQGELVGFAKVTRDLTERRAAELRAVSDARRIATAESANRAKAEFLAAMSHELRTPLNAIGGYADLLILGIQGPINDEQCTSLERIRHSQQHLLGLINDLLNFSKIEAGKLTYDIAPFDMGEIADAVRPMIEPQTLAKDIEIEWRSSHEPIMALADKPRVEQIVLNLLTNAVKFTNPGGRITVSESRADEWARIEVADNGIGIPTDKQQSIFEPFVQVGRTLTSTHEGTGLGLAISRDLARAMGGDLTVTSRLGAGSTFRLTLPRPK